jgi:predicted 3-demethylubiquinone-9 3-methyltransferase (glyoxalase superfamily)
MQKITPFLWFDNPCEEAADFYTGIFRPNERPKVQSVEYIIDLTMCDGEKSSGEKNPVEKKSSFQV